MKVVLALHCWLASPYLPQESRAPLLVGKHIYYMLAGLLSVQRVFCQSVRVRKVNESSVKKKQFSNTLDMDFFVLFEPRHIPQHIQLVLYGMRIGKGQFILD